MVKPKSMEMPFPDMSKMVEQMKKFAVPGVDIGALLEGRRKDIEALAEANRHVYEGMQALAKRQQEILKTTMGEWQVAASEMTGQGPASLATKQAEMAKRAFELALGNMRELAEVAAKSQLQAIDVVNKRVMENVEEIREKFKPK